MLRKKLPINWRMLLSRGKRSKTKKVGRNYYAAWSRITNSESIAGSSSKITRMVGIYWRLENQSSRILTHRAVMAVPTFLIKLLLTWVPQNLAANRECREIHEDLSFPGNVFDCQPARRDPDELRNTSKNLATSSGTLRREGIEKSGSEEPLTSIHLPCFQVRAREKSLDVYDKPCCGCCDLYSKWHDNTELSFLGDASGKIPRPYGISELDCELPNRRLLEGEESHARCAVDQGNRSSHITGWPHHSEVNNGQSFPWLWRIGFDDGGIIVKVLR